MRKNLIVVFLLAGVATLLWAGRTLYVLESLTPKISRKPAKELSVEGKGFRFRNSWFELSVLPLAPSERSEFFRAKGLQDPFEDLKPEQNFVFLKVRFENLGKSDKLVFLPQGTLLGDSFPFDETRIYQLFYRGKEPDKRLAAAGKVLFMRNLVLPTGFWIERLMVFRYDDPYPVRRIRLTFSNILVGRKVFNVSFNFRAHFVKEKIR